MGKCKKKMIQKYPRTPHLIFSPEVMEDDIVINQKYLGKFINNRVIISEKLDGQNNCLKGFFEEKLDYGGVFARSHQCETKLPWDSYIIRSYHNIKHLLRKECGYFFENLYAVHSIEYENLNNYNHLISIFDYKKNKVLSFDETIEESKKIRVETVPVLFDGVFTDMLSIKKWMDREIRKESAYGSTREGFVIRIADEFNINEFEQNVAKYVRKGHVQTDVHWTKNWKKANLKGK